MDIMDVSFYVFTLIFVQVHCKSCSFSYCKRTLFTTEDDTRKWGRKMGQRCKEKLMSVLMINYDSHVFSWLFSFVYKL